MILTCARCGKTKESSPTNRLWFCADCLRAEVPPSPKVIEITERPRRVEDEE